MYKNFLPTNRSRQLRVSLNFNSMWNTFSTKLSKLHIYFPPALFYSKVGGLGIWNFSNVVFYSTHNM